VLHAPVAFGPPGGTKCDKSKAKRDSSHSQAALS
jgi:hypothetical protein